MSERNWMGIEGLQYRYQNEWADPTITYKGQTFSEWEVSEGVHHWIEEGIASGDIPPGTTMETYLSDPSNHQVVTDILDDYIFARVEAAREDLASDLEQFMFERGEYDFKTDTIRWIDNSVKPELIRSYTTERIKEDLQNDSKALLRYLNDEVYTMDEEDALIDKAQNLSDRIYALDKMGKEEVKKRSPEIER